MISPVSLSRQTLGGTQSYEYVRISRRLSCRSQRWNEESNRQPAKSMTQNKIDNFILQNVVYILWKAKWTMDHS